MQEVCKICNYTCKICIVLACDANMQNMQNIVQNMPNMQHKVLYAKYAPPNLLMRLAPEPGSGQGAGPLPQPQDPRQWGHNHLPGTDVVAPTVFN